MTHIENTPEVVGPEVGPLLADADRAIIERISNGETVDNLDISALDHTVMVGLHTALATVDTALTDVAGFLSAALTLRTWLRVPKADGLPYASELEFVEVQISAHPVVARIIEGTEARRAVTKAITNVADADGKRISDRRMAELLGVKKSTVNADRNAVDAPEDTADGAERGPQTGGETVSDAKAVKRHITGYGTAGVKVRDDAHLMDAEQLLATINEAKDTLTVALGTLRLNHSDVELPEWTVQWDSVFGEVDAADRKLRSGAEGTVATGPVLKGAPVDPTAAPAAPAKPKPKPRAAAS